MRLKSNYEKVKTYIFMLVITFVVPFTCLCGLYVKGLCASSDVIEFPIPIGDNFGYGGQLSQDIVDGAISYMFQHHPQTKILTCQKISETSSGTLSYLFNCYTSDVVSLSNSNITTMRGVFLSNVYINYNSSGSIAFEYRPSTGFRPYEYGTGSSRCNLYSYVFPVTPDDTSLSDYYLVKDVFIPNYPIWCLSTNFSSDDFSLIFSDGYNSGDDSGDGSGSSITINGHSVGGGTISGGDGSSGGTDGSFDLEFDFDLDIPDYRSQLDDIGGSVDSIGESLDDIGGVVGDISDGIGSLSNKADTHTTWLQRIYAKLVDGSDGDESWLKKIYEVLVDFFQGFEIPSETDVQNELANSKMLGGIIRISNSSKQFVSSINADDIEVPSASDMDFDYPFHWQVYDFTSGNFVDKVTIVHIIFSWYESIRDKVMLVLSVFMISGFVVYIWKQVPNFINGVSGGASAGQSIADFNVNHKGVKQK